MFKLFLGMLESYRKFKQDKPLPKLPVLNPPLRLKPKL